MVAAVAELVWANSPWRAAYSDLWDISGSAALRLSANSIFGLTMD
ncbi:MAG TPA: hypothetical protein VE422_22905 [Terriglobia bacterium]|nr:hypothetical protein [Terriglobia bacterium]